MGKVNKLMYSEAIKMWDYDRNNKRPEEYTFGSHKEVNWVCPKGHKFKKAVRQMYAYPTCNTCRLNKGPVNKRTHKEFTEVLRKEMGRGYTVVTEYQGSSKPVSIEHKCGEVISYKRASTITEGIVRRCPTCYPHRNTKTPKKFSKQFNKLARGDYELLSEYKQSRKNILVKHNKCKRTYEVKANNFINGDRCPYCNISKGEEAIRIWAEERDIKIIQEVSFEGLKDRQLLLIDFYIPEYDTCIEYDGIQHYKSIPFWGGDEGLERRQYRDELKDKYCEENGIELIRILWTEFYEIPEVLDRYFRLNA